MGNFFAAITGITLQTNQLKDETGEWLGGNFYHVSASPERDYIERTCKFIQWAVNYLFDPNLYLISKHAKKINLAQMKELCQALSFWLLIYNETADMKKWLDSLNKETIIYDLSIILELDINTTKKIYHSMKENLSGDSSHERGFIFLYQAIKNIVNWHDYYKCDYPIFRTAILQSFMKAFINQNN